MRTLRIAAACCMCGFISLVPSWAKGMHLREDLVNDLPCQSQAARQLGKHLSDELEMNSGAAPTIISVFGESHWGARALPRAAIRAMHSVPTPLLSCIDMRDMARVSSTQGLAKAQRQLKDQIYAALKAKQPGATIVVVEHAEAARGSSVRLLDAFLELFNGERSHMEWNGGSVSAGGVVFFLLFESSKVVPAEASENGDSRAWREHLQGWLHHDGDEFTEGAFVGRLGAGIVLKDATCGASEAGMSVCEGLSGAKRAFPPWLPWAVAAIAVSASVGAYCYFSASSSGGGSSKPPPTGSGSGGGGGGEKAAFGGDRNSARDTNSVQGGVAEFATRVPAAEAERHGLQQRGSRTAKVARAQMRGQSQNAEPGIEQHERHVDTSTREGFQPVTGLRESESGRRYNLRSADRGDARHVK